MRHLPISKPNLRKVSGFTLIELLVVISIIAILATLILAGVQSARQSMLRAQVKSEITGLEAALEDFKREYGVYPPSSITLCEEGDDWSTEARSQSIIKSIWPSIDFTLDHQFNDNTTAGEKVQLNGAECLVFFLGGVFSKDADGNPSPNGFSKNTTDPFQSPTVSPNRVGPYFDFKRSRLVINDNKDVHYLDPISGQTTPYWYISSYEGKGYRYKYHSSSPSMTPTQAVADSGHELPSSTGSLAGLGYVDSTNKVDMSGATVPTDAMFMPYLQSGNHPYIVDSGTIKSTHQPWKPSGFQIISPGPDGRYGSGGVYKEGDSTKLSESDRDNITNFATGALN